VSAADEPVPDSLPELFWSVAHRLRRQSMQTLAPWDISPSHSRALAVLQRHGVMRLRELSEHLRIAPRSATEVVDALEERGLVERRDDPHDRRATLVAVSAEGERVGAAIEQARADEAQAFFGALSPADSADLRRLLARLAANRER
jgi:DNA-binding MarR family transcriptional regulator